MRRKSVIREAQEIQFASELIKLGARLQLLEAETHLSREKLLNLYKEIKGVSPPKGMLPYSTDYFTTWLPNIHASLFANIYRCLYDHAGTAGIDAVVKSYRLYLEQVSAAGLEPLFGLTRAWTLVRFMDNRMLETAPCTRCGGDFVVHTHDPRHNFVCGLCRPPARAGKTKKAARS